LFKWFSKNKQKTSEQSSEQGSQQISDQDESQQIAEHQDPVQEDTLEKAIQNDDEPTLNEGIESQSDSAVDALSDNTAQAKDSELAGRSEVSDRILVKQVNTENADTENADTVNEGTEDENLQQEPNSAEKAPEANDEDVSAQAPAKTSEAKRAPEKAGFFAKLKSSLSRTKENIGSGFVALLKGKSIDDDLYEELETQLLVADVGMKTTSNIIDKLTESAKLFQLKDGDALAQLLKQQMRDILAPVSVPFELNAPNDEQGKANPFVILMVGVNGVGKTTTIGKLAKQFQAQGKKVMLAAGDTFRAAAVEQLQVWGERNDIQVIAQPTGSDSASVIFDALASAKARGADVLIADTAGRLQNKDNLIEELKKVVRVMKKQVPDAPHEIMLTLDASTGQNAVSQTKIFNDAVGITGINLTKLDGTAKGGVIFALADEFKIPVRYIGIGEGIDDLRPFESGAFVDALFDETH
jgi:fused signal recognition particle receptor